MNKNQNLSKKVVLYTTVIVGLMVVLVVVNQLSTKKEQVQSFDDRPSIEGQPTLGSPNAKVSVVEFGDYKCPACKAWSEQYFPRLKQDYIDTGKISFSFVNAMFHGGESRLAAMAAESVFAQDSQAFWTFNDELFKAQPEADHDAAWITTDKLLEIAEAHTPQIDRDKLLEDINNQTFLPQHEADNALIEKFNVEQTPTIIINGIKLSDPFDYEKIKEMIEEQLKEG